MKKILLIIAVTILSACTTSSPEGVSVKSSDTTTVERLPIEEPVILLGFNFTFLQQDTIKDTTKISKKEEEKIKIEKIKKENAEQQKNVMVQIEKLEEQQIVLDSLLKAKEKK